MSFVGLLTFGIVLQLLLPLCAKAAPGMGAGPSALSTLATTSTWSRTGLPAGTSFFRTAERSAITWTGPELRRLQAAVVPLSLSRLARLASETFSLHPLSRGPLPQSNFLQRAFITVSAMRPDVTLQSVPGYGGMRIMLAVDTLSLFRR